MQAGRLLEDERLCRAVLCVSGKALLQLEDSFGQALWQAQHKSKPERQRAVGGGRRGQLSTVQAKLIFILVYLKYYPTFDVLGWLFGMDRSRACRRGHQLLPVLEMALERECVLPARQIRSASEFLQAFPGVQDVFLDGTERPVQKQLPGKGTKKQPLTAQQKQNNRVIAGIRVVVEHAIAGIKRFACMAHVYRNRCPKVDDRFALLSCGL